MSASTKISVTLLEGLERDDLSRWPAGIYRRSFFRAYLTAVGLGPEAFAGELPPLFPDDSSELPVAAPSTPARHEPLALVLADGSSRSLWRRTALALVEAALVVAFGALAAWAGGISILAGGGIVALLYYPFLRAAGQPGAWPWSIVSAFRSRRRAARQAPVEPSPHAEADHGAALPLQVASTEEGDHDAADAPGDGERPVRIGAFTRAGNALAQAGAASRRHVQSVLAPVGRAVTRLFVVIAAVCRRLGLIAARAGSFVMRHAARLCVRCLRALNYVLWKGVRAAADRAERVAARQLGEARTDSASQTSSGNT